MLDFWVGIWVCFHVYSLVGVYEGSDHVEDLVWFAVLLIGGTSRGQGDEEHHAEGYHGNGSVDRGSVRVCHVW